ncbi:MAG: hypothetical protein ACR2PG_27515 [Hyphomicrobiaceae bacterium]
MATTNTALRFEPSRIEAYAIAAVLGLFGLVVVVQVLPQILMIRLIASQHYSEGWNAFHALSAFSSSPLYPNPTELVTNNYPPTSFYIVGALGFVTGDLVVAGRIVCLLAYCVCGLNIGLVLWRLTASHFAVIFGTLFFFGYTATFFDAFTASNDPQWLAYAFMTSGLLLFISSPRKPSRLVLATVLIFLAGMTKHSLILLPLAITIWLLAIRAKRELLIWLATSGALLSVSFLVLFIFYGSAFFYDVIGYEAHRSYSWDKTVRTIGWYLPRFAAPIIACVFWSIIDRRCYSRLISVYAFLSIGFGFYSIGGYGIHYNCFFDMVIALSLVSGLLVDAIVRRSDGLHVEANRNSRARAGFLPLMVVLAISAPVFASSNKGIVKLDRRLASFSSLAASSQKDIDYLSAIRGPVMCENLALCYWSKKDFQVDYFNAGLKIGSGLISPEPLLNRINNRFYSAIQIESVSIPVHPLRLPESVVKAILDNYSVTYRSRTSGFVLTPNIAVEETN